MQMITGSRAAPAAIGEKPATTCSETTSRKKTPRQRRVHGERHHVGGREQAGRRRPRAAASGAALRRSATTKATRPRTPTSNGAQTLAAAGPASGQAISPKVRPARPAAASTAPGTSRPGAASGSRALGHVPEGDEHDDGASGRFSRNTQRQPGALHQPARRRRGRSPPRGRRSPLHAPIARARSSGRNDAWMMARLPGVSSAPPTPCRARASDEHEQVRGEPAQQGRQREPHHADEEDPAAAEQVAERAAEQDQRGEGEGVAVDGPLQAVQRGVQVPADRRECHVDDGPVEHRHARAEDGRQQNCPRPRRPVDERVGHGALTGTRRAARSYASRVRPTTSSHPTAGGTRRL